MNRRLDLDDQLLLGSENATDFTIRIGNDIGSSWVAENVGGAVEVARVLLFDLDFINYIANIIVECQDAASIVDAVELEKQRLLD